MQPTRQGRYVISGLNIISGTNSRIVQKSISSPYWISDPNSRIIQKSISGPYWISDPIVQILVFIYLVSCLYGIRVIKWNSQLNLGRRSYSEFELWTFRYDTSTTTQAGTGRYLQVHKHNVSWGCTSPQDFCQGYLSLLSCAWVVE